MDKNLLTDEIRHLADSQGIDTIGFTGASEFHGYMLNKHQRGNPKLTLPNAKSIIVAGVYIGGLTMPEWNNAFYGRTSRLYLSGFFLDVVKPLLPIVEFLRHNGYQTKICDGSREGGSILPLKLAAVRSGLGWQGKHSLLISKKYGTFLALGGIITDAGLMYNSIEEPDRCRNCDKCQKACPLGALNQAYVLNVKSCMSYLLQNDNISEDLKMVMENRIGDCEICQDSCPWNRKHLKSPLVTKMTSHFQKKIKDWAGSFSLSNLYGLSEKGYKDLFGPLNTDLPYHLFRRNVLTAMERAERLAKKINN